MNEPTLINCRQEKKFLYFLSRISFDVLSCGIVEKCKAEDFVMQPFIFAVSPSSSRSWWWRHQQRLKNTHKSCSCSLFVLKHTIIGYCWDVSWNTLLLFLLYNLRSILFWLHGQLCKNFSIIICPYSLPPSHQNVLLLKKMSHKNGNGTVFTREKRKKRRDIFLMTEKLKEDDYIFFQKRSGIETAGFTGM